MVKYLPAKDAQLTLTEDEQSAVYYALALARGFHGLDPAKVKEKYGRTWDALFDALAMNTWQHSDLYANAWPGGEIGPGEPTSAELAAEADEARDEAETWAEDFTQASRAEDGRGGH